MSADRSAPVGLDSASVPRIVELLTYFADESEFKGVQRAENGDAEEAANYAEEAADLRATAAALPALVEAGALLDRMKLYRAPCWELDPNDETSGLHRIDWLSWLLSDVRSWLTQYPAIRDEHADAASLEEGINEVAFLCAGLQAAVRAELAAPPAAPALREEAP